MRLHQRHVAALDEQLSPALEQAVRALLTSEEHHWQRELQHQRERKSGVCLVPSSASPVPLHKMAALLQALQLVLHQTSVSFIEAQSRKTTAAVATVEDTCDGNRNAGRHVGLTSTSSSFTEQENEVEAQHALELEQRHEVLQAALNTERALAEEVKQQVSTALPTGAGVSVVALPCDRPVPAPVLRLEAAVSVALLSSMIEKAESITAGMEFASHLLRQYILPHVYADYAGWAAVRPRLGTLSEQVTHLATLPLRVQQQQSLIDAAVQAQADAKYLEGVVKSWTMRAWLQGVIRHRQCLAQQAATERVVARLRGRVELHRMFSAWRREAQRGQQLVREARMEAAYIEFLNESRLSALRDNQAYVGTAATMATALLMYGPETSAEPVATMWSRVQQQQQQESGQRQQELAAGNREGSSATGIHASAASTMVDTPAGWAVAPSHSRGRSAQASLSPPPSRHRHETHSSKRKGAGYSRVQLSFIRRKAAGVASAEQERAGEAGTRSLQGSNASAANEVVAREDGKCGMMERYIVRDASSEDQSEGSNDEDNAIDGGGTLAQLVYLESHADDIQDEGNRSYHARSTAPSTFPASDINASLAEATSSRGGDAGGVPMHPLFQTMLAKLHEIDRVNAYLRAELAVQSRRLRKVEAANHGLRERNRQLEDGTLQLLRDKLEALNTAQEQLMTIKEKNRQLRHVRSRLRAHRHRPWQNTVLRVVGDMCEVSTAAAEGADEARVHADRYGTGCTTSDDDDGDEGELGNASPHAAKSAVAAEATADGREATATMSVTSASTESRAAPPRSESDEERLFSRIAPIVLRSDRQLPDALVIIADWANSCLDDLECLDDMKDGPLAERFHSFSEEARSGVLISRLLYYLALPRYRTTTSAAEMERGVGASVGMSDSAGARLDGIDRRRQLLEQHGVQLNPPFPVYADCFGDLLAAPPVERMSQLLAFATELMAGQDVSAQEQNEAWRANTTNGENTSGQATVDVRVSAAEAGDVKRSPRAAVASLPTLSAPLPLHTAVDPHAIVRGERSAVITLVALLYVRFAHPFHHKSLQSAKRERSALLYLWSGGQATAAELNGIVNGSLRDAAGGGGSPAEITATLDRAPPSGYSIEADMLRQLPTEDKTAWQLFRERCLPVFGTQAHPFLLRGGFWPSDAFESPELAAMLSTLAIVLRRSLELHRWHVTLNCLVPVRTYGGLSNGVFTGPCASAPALLLGLRQDGKENLSIEHPLIRQCVEQRQQAYLNALASETFGASLTSVDDEAAKPPTQQQHLTDPTAETASLTDAITGLWQEDLLSLFVQRATLSAHLALPVLDLGSWRMLCSDLGVISLASPDSEDAGAHDSAVLRRRESGQSQMQVQSLWSRQPKPQLQAIDMEVVTKLFQRAVMAVSFARDEVDPAVLQSARTAREASSQTAPAATELRREGDDRRSRSPKSSMQHQTLPDIQMDMTYPSFVMALVLLAHRLYPAFISATPAGVAVQPLSSPTAFVGSWESSTLASSDDGRLGGPASLPPYGDEANRSRRVSSSKPTYCSLMEAFRFMMQGIVLPSSAAHLQATDPRFVLHQLTRGVRTQVVLRNCAPALLLVFQTYSKEVFGEPGMVRKDVLRLLRDAMLTSTELSQHRIHELFSSCSVLRQANEEVAIANRKEMDRLAHANGGPGSLPLSSRRPGYRAVRIVDPDAATESAVAQPAHRKRAHVLTFEGFCDFLCVLCGFKQPNVFVPFEERLLSFLHHSLLRPLTHMVPALASLVSRSQLAGGSNSVLVSSGTAGAGSVNNDGISSHTGGGGGSGVIGACGAAS
ncbi:conserved hypothetical protein [Leishmania infantum JPCM5]|uniref:Uncharacterized protein n=3 Tax=Leishmania donovani species complex TaxID=38574 RepID=A4HUU2_LEIIN|nr:conserved hypothetical protein [Leishmania infantum JPCM5]CAC9460068.1 hypothetical_protein_-_conserved [Leishmania infantum]CAM66203.1 conserved hypothetical protein [Leishmania infantum JPCM5]SUZ39811.1 hypothetical_protein_-_conserved [Leishmania infantum]VDZ42749.1 hypothetical_protein_conserved [Leishmania donovani]|eukprot:XP_001463833.1 conserved hypothetical protein [Leishmania infantum JPCM5]